MYRNSNDEAFIEIELRRFLTPMDEVLTLPFTAWQADLIKGNAQHDQNGADNPDAAASDFKARQD